MAIRDYDSYIEDAAAKNGLNPDLLRAVMEVESGGNPRAISRKKDTGEPIAYGAMQFTPGTAKTFGINPLDPVQSIYAGAKYLRQNHDRFGGDTNLALAAYNAGPEAVAKYGGIPPFAETRAYIPKVYSKFLEYASLRSGTATDAQPAMMARQTEAAPEVQPTSIQRNIAPITGLTRTEDVVQQVSAPFQAQPQEQDQDLLEIQRAWEAKQQTQQAQQPSSEDADLLEIQKAWEAKQAAKQQQQVLQDAILQGSDVGGQVQNLSGKELPYAGVGIVKGLANDLATLASTPDTRAAGIMLSSGITETPMETVPRAKLAKNIRGAVMQATGLDQVAEPTGAEKITQGLGQGLAGFIPAMGAGKIVSGMAGAARPAASSTLQAIAELSPKLGAALGLGTKYGGASLRDALTFGGMGAMDPENPAQGFKQGAATGAAFGLASQIPQLAGKLAESPVAQYLTRKPGTALLDAMSENPALLRAITGASVGYGAEALQNPQASIEDKIAAATTMGLFGSLGEGKGYERNKFVDQAVESVFNKAVRPKFKVGSTPSQYQEWLDRGKNAAREVFYTTKEEGVRDSHGNVEQKLPETMIDFANGVQQAKWNKVAENRDLRQKAGEIVEPPSVEPVIKALDDYIKAKTEIIGPDLKDSIKYAEEWKADLVDPETKRPRTMTLEQLDARIKELNNNDNMQSFLATKNPDTARRVNVDAIVRKGMNELLYGGVEEGTTSGRFGQNRKTLGDLMAVEGDITKAAIRIARAADKNLFNLVEPFAAAHLAQGLLTLGSGGAIPLAKVLSMEGAKRFIQHINDPNRRVKHMFEVMDRELPPKTKVALPEPMSRERTQPVETELDYELYKKAPGYQPVQQTPPVGVPAAGTQPGISGPGEPVWNRQQFIIVERPQPVGARVRGAVESPTPIGPPQGVPASEPTGMPPQAYRPRTDRSVVEELPKNIILKSARPDFTVSQERTLPYVEGGREVPVSPPERLPKEAYAGIREREILESLPKWRKVIIKSARPDYTRSPERSLPYVSGATEVPPSGPTGLPVQPQTVSGGSANEAVMDFLAAKLGHAKVKSIGNLIEQASAARRPSQRAMDVVDLLNQISDTIATGQEMSTARHLVEQLQEKIALKNQKRR